MKSKFWNAYLKLINSQLKVQLDDNFAFRKLQIRRGFQIGWWNIYLDYNEMSKNVNKK